jgi:uncharacterized membrane protein (DUF4010 family)
VLLALALFIGLEREEHKQREAAYSFGGIRTFPLIGLVSYALALISDPEVLPWAIGFAVIGSFMLLSYFHKLRGEVPAGLTSEISGLAIYVVGGLVQREYYWIGTTIGVLSVLLLELKKGLEGLTRHIASDEIITAAKFLVLSVVILPIVPHEDLTPFHLNPFKIWLVVVAVSGVSFASYALQRFLKDRGGVMLSALLGGAYSSTVTTVVLARKAKADPRPNLYSGSILAASGVMYLRLGLLLFLFNRDLAAELAPSFAGLAVAACAVGWTVSRRNDGNTASRRPDGDVKNPLELKAAFLFALVFVVVLVLTHLAREYLGRGGLYSLAAILGLADVDPFILGIAQSGTTTPLQIAATAILIAASSNNVMKAIYAYGFADRGTGRAAAAMLFALAVLGLLPLAWI